MLEVQRWQYRVSLGASPLAAASSSRLAALDFACMGGKSNAKGGESKDQKTARLAAEVKEAAANLAYLEQVQDGHASSGTWARPPKGKGKGKGKTWNNNSSKSSGKGQGGA